MNLLDKLPEEILNYIWFLAHDKSKLNKDIQILSILWSDINKMDKINFIDFISIFKTNNCIESGDILNVKKIIMPSPHVKIGNYWQKIQDVKSQLIVDFEEYYPEYISMRLPIIFNNLVNKCKLMQLLK